MKTTAVYFSPTGNTKKSVDAMARALDADYQAVDLTVAQGEDGQEFPVQMRFSGEDFVIFGMPVYGGRLPALAAERLSGIRGEQTPCVLVVTYGNRHYDDALVELQDLCEAQGFVVKGAAALVGRHTYGEIQVGQARRSRSGGGRGIRQKGRFRRRPSRDDSRQPPLSEAAHGKGPVRAAYLRCLYGLRTLPETLSGGSHRTGFSGGRGSVHFLLPLYPHLSGRSQEHGHGGLPELCADVYAEAGGKAGERIFSVGLNKYPMLRPQIFHIYHAQRVPAGFSCHFRSPSFLRFSSWCRRPYSAF